MRKQMLAVLTVIHLSASGLVSAQTGSHPTPAADAKPSVSAQQLFMSKFVGAWAAAPSEVRLVSDLDLSVWGPNASSIRKVEVVIQPSGEGSIKVTRSVVDGRGRTKPYSVSVEQAQLVVRMPEQSDANRIEATVEVRNGERTYPDTPKDRWKLDGLMIGLVATDPKNQELNLRFDMPDGRGSFGETLMRRAPAGTAGRAGRRGNS